MPGCPLPGTAPAETVGAKCVECGNGTIVLATDEAARKTQFGIGECDQYDCNAFYRQPAPPKTPLSAEQVADYSHQIAQGIVVPVPTGDYPAHTDHTGDAVQKGEYLFVGVPTGKKCPDCGVGRMYIVVDELQCDDFNCNHTEKGDDPPGVEAAARDLLAAIIDAAELDEQGIHPSEVVAGTSDADLLRGLDYVDLDECTTCGGLRGGGLYTDAYAEQVAENSLCGCPT